MEPLEKKPPAEGSLRTVAYQIDVQGRLDERWNDWFGGMTVAYEEGVTTLTGPIADQAALRGMLSKIWDLNLVLIAVRRLETSDDVPADV